MDWEQLLIWRHKRNMTQAALAKYLDVHRKTVVRWEKGGPMPRNIAAQLEAVALKAAPNQQPSEADKIYPDTKSSLYEWIKTLPVEKPTHPHQLFPGHWGDKHAPLAFLDTDEYKAAVAAHEDAERARMHDETVRAIEEVFANGPDVPLPHAPTCRCNYCQTVKTAVSMDIPIPK